MTRKVSAALRGLDLSGRLGRTATWQRVRTWRGGLLRRLIAYGLGSVVAATIGELAFIGVFGWLRAGNVAASAAGFVGGAVPNYIVNRRWVWGDRRGRRSRSETLLYTVVALTSFGASVVGTGLAERGASSLAVDHDWQVALVAAAYLGVAAVFFVAKFVAFHFIVFTTTTPEAAIESDERSPVHSTTS